MDFCPNYKLNQSNKESLPHFINKLRENNQTDQQQEQASDAKPIYYETGSTQFGEKASLNNKNLIISTKRRGVKTRKYKLESGLR